MTDVLVRIENLTKHYALGGSMRLEAAKGGPIALLRRILRSPPPSPRPDPSGIAMVKALGGVSFEAHAGEVLGIIGRNGAGKTTLLKILARVQPPTSGRAVLRGRLVALLELGVAFAPDMSVSDTIVMFGMAARVPRGEVRKLEAGILAMAGLEEFRDAPLRACPAGSFVRLCFAALMRFPADIVLADEILAVGDTSFREAAEQRMSDIASGGGTVLFVSHDMNALRRICTRLVWLEKGQVRMSGRPAEIIDAYMAETMGLDPGEIGGETPGFRILDVRLLDAEGSHVGVLQLTEAGTVECVFVVDGVDPICVEMELWRSEWHVLTALSEPVAVRPGRAVTARVTVPANLLNDGSYEVRVHLRAASPPGDVLASARLDLRVLNAAAERSVWADWTKGRPGLISPPSEWSFRMLPTGEQKVAAS